MIRSLQSVVFSVAKSYEEDTKNTEGAAEIYNLYVDFVQEILKDSSWEELNRNFKPLRKSSITGRS